MYSVDRVKANEELVTRFKTTARYCHRQGLSWQEMEAALAEVQKPVAVPFVPELISKGVDDRRDGRMQS